ncbi:MAG TPA: YlxR family protein, partial [Myxococcaceae bacterium]|nr:YlxR family protein [Myxococcaceae bacterium]
MSAPGIHSNVRPRNGTPQRTCIGCGRSRAKPDLIRVALGADERPRVDAAGVMPGRGAYLCGSG